MGVGGTCWSGGGVIDETGCEFFSMRATAVGEEGEGEEEEEVRVATTLFTADGDSRDPLLLASDLTRGDDRWSTEAER